MVSLNMYQVNQLLVTLMLSVHVSVISSDNINGNRPKMTKYNGQRVGRNPGKSSSKISHQDIWTEINDSIILNCSLRVNKDQHVVWHRKYDKLGVHVLTIESETFISDLRIRPIKEKFPVIGKEDKRTIVFDGGDSKLDKLTWNLEIRRLKLDDSALYYCVLNSENSYGQIYKLNVLPHLTSLNGSQVLIDDRDYQEDVPTRISLICQYHDIIEGQRNQIRWYFHHYKLNNNLKNFHIVETKDIIRNITTSILYIDNSKSKEHLGRYRCHYKGLYKVIKVQAAKKRLSVSSSNRLVHDAQMNEANSVVLNRRAACIGFNLFILLKYLL